jgi:hypothetical protein
MDTVERSDHAGAAKTPQCGVPMVALASTVAFAAAGSLLGFSLFVPREKRSVPAQLCLGLLVVCAGAVTWKRRKEEADAARHLLRHIHKAQDARWLRKNPVTYA